MIDKHLSEVKHQKKNDGFAKQNKNAQENTTIRDRVSPLSTESKKNHHAQMVSYRKDIKIVFRSAWFQITRN